MLKLLVWMVIDYKDWINSPQLEASILLGLTDSYKPEHESSEPVVEDACLVFSSLHKSLLTPARS